MIVLRDRVLGRVDGEAGQGEWPMMAGSFVSSWPYTGRRRNPFVGGGAPTVEIPFSLLSLLIIRALEDVSHLERDGPREVFDAFTLPHPRSKYVGPLGGTARKWLIQNRSVVSSSCG